MPLSPLPIYPSFLVYLPGSNLIFNCRYLSGSDPVLSDISFQWLLCAFGSNAQRCWGFALRWDDGWSLSLWFAGSVLLWRGVISGVGNLRVSLWLDSLLASFLLPSLVCSFAIVLLQTVFCESSHFRWRSCAPFRPCSLPLLIPSQVNCPVLVFASRSRH